MYPDSQFARPIGSFQYPVQIIADEPDADPLETICINSTWLAYLRGAAKQLLLQSTWATQDPGDLALMQQRTFNLIGLMQNGVCTPAARVPDWQAVNNRPGSTRQFFGQRGQGINGPFFDYAGLGSWFDLTFEDIHTHAAVGGLINFLTVSVLGEDLCSIVITPCLGPARSEAVSIGDHDILGDLFGGPAEIKAVSVSSGDSSYLRMILKNDWTCGEL
jgi:hypothetical protein